MLHDLNAGRQAIRSGLDWLAACSAADPEATVVVFFSGHGWLDSAGGGYYLIPADVDPFDIPGSALAASDFSDALRRILARRLLVILDCCHAGGMATAKENVLTVKLPGGYAASAPPKALLDQLKHGSGRAVFSSSRGDQVSWVRSDGTLSLYSAHLIEALRGAGSQDGETEVRLSSLMRYLSYTVTLSARALGKEQTPYFDIAAEDFPVALVRGGKSLEPSCEVVQNARYAPSPLSGVTQTIENHASNQGAQGVFQGSVTFNFGVQSLPVAQSPKYPLKDKPLEDKPGENTSDT
jgi:hypothetical protein